MYFKLKLLLIFSVLSLLFSCKDSGPNPTEPDDSAYIIESKKFTVGPEGGEFFLSDNSGVTFPAGAVTSSTAITISKMKPELYNLSNEYVVLNFECTPNTFQKEVKIFIASNIQSEKVKTSGGYFDRENSVFEISSTELSVNKGTFGVTISTNHFSPYCGHFWEWPPAESGPLDVSYYNQGETPYCWANCLQMICESISPSETMEVFDWIRETGIGYDGAGQLFLRTNAALKKMIKTRTGVAAETQIWSYKSGQAMDTYLKHCIALGYPVMLNDPYLEHAYLVVGYSGNTFYIHDPQSTNTKAVCYTPRQWEDFKANNLGLKDAFISLAIPTNSKSTKLQTLNISNGLIKVSKPKDANSVGRNFAFKWVNNSVGYNFFESSFSGLGSAVDTLPDGVDIITVNAELANADRLLSKNMKVSVDIWAINNNKQHKGFFPATIKTIAPKSLESYEISIPINEFRDSTFPATTTYKMLISAIDNGESKITDQITIYFSIEAPKPNLKFKSISLGGSMVIHFEKSSSETFDQPEMDLNYYKIPMTFSELKGTFFKSSISINGEVSGSVTLSPKLDIMTVSVNLLKNKDLANEVLESFVFKDIPVKLTVNGTTIKIDANPPNNDPLPYIKSINGYAKAWPGYQFTEILSYSALYLTLQN